MAEDNLFGIHCFMHECSGFYGAMKTYCEDFQVTEIDLAGRLANDDGTLETSSLPIIPFTPMNSEIAAQQCEEEEIKWEEARQDPRMFIGRFVDCRVLDDLDQVSEDGSNSQQNIFVGTFADKRTRSILHECLRYLHPGMLTKTLRTQQGVDIYLELDPVFTVGVEMLGVDNVRELFRFVNCRNLWRQISSDEMFERRSDTCYLLVGQLDKKQRTNVHRFIEKNFGKRVRGKTLTLKSTVVIAVQFSPKKGQQKPNGNGSVVKFAFHKTGLETLEAFRRISDVTHIPLNAFKFAGTKDKYATTHQFVTVDAKFRSQLLAYDGSVKGCNGSGVYMNGIHKVDKHLNLGDLRGNRFKLTLRNLQLSRNDFTSATEPHITPLGTAEVNLQSIVEQNMQNIATLGFINYFGVQRFGSHGPPFSFDIGLRMLQGRYREAVDLILCPSISDSQVTQTLSEAQTTQLAKRKFTETRSIEDALVLMPKSRVRERLVLQALKRFGDSDDGYVKALLSIPHNMRSIYVHAYASQLWNCVVSHRIRIHCLKPVLGDLVVTRSNDTIIDDADITASNPCSTRISKDQLHVVTTANDLDLYTIRDVVLPLPGRNAQLPSNMEELYLSQLHNDGLTLESFQLRVIDLNISAAYRRVVAIPEALHWTWVNGTGIVDESLQVTVKEVMGGGDGCHTSPSEHEIHCSRNECKEGFLEIDFILPSSSYATICLREIMKN